MASQALVDWAMKKAAGFLGKPTKEGFSITTDAHGNVMAWFHKKF